MDKKSKIILVLLIVTLLSLSSYASLSRFSKGINKEGSIQTTEMEYCRLNEIETLNECLIRNDSKQEMSLALDTIDDRTSRLNLNKVEPSTIYVPTTTYTDIADKTSLEAIASTTAVRYTYVVESKLINPFSVNDNEIENISFNQETGYYTFNNSLTGDINDIVTTEEDMNNGIYRYTCMNATVFGDCANLFLFTEEPYIVNGDYKFKQGYTYSYMATDTTSTNAGLYKGDDDYTVNSDTHTYYYRGNVNNNWVRFGNSLWRVVRINGNGTIRMIYSGLVDAPNHTGDNAQILTSAYSYITQYTPKVPDVSGLTNNLISVPYANGRYSITYVGYMFNPAKGVFVYPDKEVGNDSENRLNKFPLFTNMSGIHAFYFFKNFDEDNDCDPGDGTDDSGTCILKCKKLGNDGDEGVDCVQSIWNTLATTEGNFSTTAPGVYPENNPTQYVYTSEYKYTCWGVGAPTTKENSDGTTSVYVACSNVSEIVGTIKNQPTQARIRYHSVISPDVETANTNVLDSRIKERIETWYQNNIYNTKDENNNYLEDYLADGIFCNDRSTDGANFPFASFGPYTRNSRSKNASFKCLNIDGTFNTNDAFTLKTSNTLSTVEASGIGNKLLKYPVGLITLDEAAFAGGKIGSINNGFYLYTGSTYWTMSPTDFGENHLYSFEYTIANNGNLNTYPTMSAYGVRPVINLKSDILYKGGTGTEEDPYIIDINN